MLYAIKENHVVDLSSKDNNNVYLMVNYGLADSEEFLRTTDYETYLIARKFLLKSPGYLAENLGKRIFPMKNLANREVAAIARYLEKYGNGISSAYMVFFKKLAEAGFCLVCV